jgi:dipeptide transport system ATP-binding protein
MPLLEIEDLHVEFPTQGSVMHAVEGVSLTVEEGEVLGIVGESGSGKSVAMMAVMGLIAAPGKVRARKLRFAGNDLLGISDPERRRLVGKDMAMIFQEPTTSLNPCFTIGYQLVETLRLHTELSKNDARRRAIELLDQVGIPAAASRLGEYPHQMSGGMNQRVMIAMAISCNPRLLIADEVMYAGQVMEERSVASLFADPQHPYTEALLAALPERGPAGHRLATIPGVVPGVFDRPSGCLFAPRCAYATEHSMAVRPELRSWRDGQVRCHYPLGDPSRMQRIQQDVPVAIEGVA